MRVVVTRHSLQMDTVLSFTSVQLMLLERLQLPAGTEMVMPGDNLKFDSRAHCAELLWNTGLTFCDP